MTISDIATMKGVSVQAVYQRIKRAGLHIESLKQSGNTGELTADGIYTVLNLFASSSEASADKKAGLNNQSTVSTSQSDLLISELKAKCDELTAENAALRAAAEKDRATISALTDQLSRLSDQIMQQATTAQRLADQAQQLHALQLKALPQPSPNPLRRWFYNLTGKNKAPEADA